MTTIKWIIVGIFAFLSLYYGFKLVIEMVWQKRLNKFKKTVGEPTINISYQMIFKNVYQAVLGLFVVAAVFMTLGQSTQLIANKTYIDAKNIGSHDELSALLTTYTGYQNYLYDESVGVPEADVALDGTSNTRSYTETNVQVEGVDESDVIKTDGYHIYYAPRYQNELLVFSVDDQGEITLEQTINLNDFYIEGMFITDTQVILIGYTYQTQAITTDEFYCGWFYVNDTASVRVFDKDNMALTYELTTDSHFYDYRLIGDVLYLISQKYIYQNTEEYRPEYIVNKDGIETTSYLSYDQMFYFEQEMTNSMMVITSLHLDNLTYDAQAFMVQFYLLYATQESFYMISYFYGYDEVENSWLTYAHVLKFSIQEDLSLKYVATGSFEGYIQSQYWMDEYDGYFRLVTTDWFGKNRLYVFVEDPNIDKLNVLSLVDEGIGFANETVKSVRFNGEIAQIVTYETHDPLYTIDLSNPNQPVIESSPIIENGYSTYLHVWDQDNHLVGFGFDADDQGFVTSLKLSAYDTNLTEPLSSFIFDESDEYYQFNYSEAIYNPKALLINVSKNIFAFPMSAYIYDDLTNYYSYEAYYYIFSIDFSNTNVLGNPIVITHDETINYNQIDRGVEIENKIYTFSRTEIVVFDLNTMAVSQKLYY